MLSKISCIILDDDQVDRLIIEAYLKNYAFIELAGSYESVSDVLNAVEKFTPDCIFLDIDLPRINGMELRRKLLHIPACVFVTSYPEYAVEGFELSGLDFLVKPVSAERFKKSIGRLQEYITLRRKSDLLSHSLGADTVFIKDGHDRIKLQLHEIIYLEALNNYTGIVTRNRKYAVLTPISKLLKEKPFRKFVRIHRSYAVQKNYIGKISADDVQLNDSIVLPVGRTYRDSLKMLRG